MHHLLRLHTDPQTVVRGATVLSGQKEDAPYLWIEIPNAPRRYPYAARIVEDTPNRMANHSTITVDIQYERPVVPYSVLHPSTVVTIRSGMGRNETAVGAAVVDHRWEEAAKRTDWKVLSPDERLRKPLELQRRLHVKEYAWLRLGATPLSMDDHWFIFYEDGHGYYHRSWTGICVYEVQVEPASDGFIINQAWSFADQDLSFATKELLIQLIEGTCREAHEVYDWNEK